MSNSAEIPEHTVIEEVVTAPDGNTSLRRYFRGKFLGKGGFAKVYEVTNSETGAAFAGKVLSKATLKKSRARQKLMSEIKIHKSLDHPNIVVFKHCFEDPENVYILLELCRNQTLSELMRRRKRLTELEVQCYMSQVLSGVRHLHAHKIIHRDIKLGNLFLNDKMEVKIGDFGLATKLEFDSERKRTICGTPNYIAPEILDGKQGHSYEVDVWSLGVLLYVLLVGKPPFEGQDVKTTYRRIAMNAYSFPEKPELSTAAKKLITAILVNDPVLRPKIQELRAHSFFDTPFPKMLPPSTLSVPLSSERYQRTQSLKGTQVLLSQQVNKATDNGKLTRVQSLKGGGSVSMYFPVSAAGPDIWVKQWVDYSTKYGLGYLLSDNSVGALFNDSTKMSYLLGDSRFQYIHIGREKEEIKEFSVHKCPPELSKKLTLLKHFREQLPESSGGGDSTVHLKQWLITAHATIFRLSNKTVQICFHDKTEIILCSPRKEVTYVDKHREVTTCSLKGLTDSRPDLTKRLKYTKTVLARMINS